MRNHEKPGFFIQSLPHHQDYHRNPVSSATPPTKSIETRFLLPTHQQSQLKLGLSQGWF